MVIIENSFQVSFGKPLGILLAIQIESILEFFKVIMENSFQEAFRNPTSYLNGIHFRIP